jgi:hypothetical protein
MRKGIRTDALIAASVPAIVMVMMMVMIVTMGSRPDADVNASAVMVVMVMMVPDHNLGDPRAAALCQTLIVGF